MAEGRLKAAFNDKGFTFIAEDGGGKDVFLHVSQIQQDEDKTRFIGGAYVTYEVETVNKGGVEKPQARAARLVPVNHRPKSVIAFSLRGVVKFWQPAGFGFIVDQSTGTEYYANTTSVQGGYLKPGDHLTFDVEQEPGGVRACNVVVDSWSATGDPFEDELDLGNPNWVVPLAELAEKKEEWNYKIKPSKDRFVILRSYLKYTFLRQRELDGHLVYAADDQHMAFNTGLVTDFQEEIFAVFIRSKDPANSPQWKLESFQRASAEAFLRRFGGDIPALAWYYQGSQDLVYDTALQLRVNVEHVPHDPDRFPESLKAFSAEDLAGLVNAKAPEAIERVKRNYKTAIPQFYRDSRNTGAGKMQLLLPVGLVRRDQVELALAVDRLDSGVYLGRTVLTLDWAYNNARLITRPDTDWLQP